MQILVVGCGRVGSEIARDLARTREISKVVVVDSSRPNLSSVAGVRKVKTVHANIFQGPMLRNLATDSDLVCGALPGRFGFKLMQSLVGMGKNFVDISYTPVDPFKLDREARRNHSLVVPQCGVAPGLSNMCVGDAVSKIDGPVESVSIMVGGLPQDPEPPLNYRFVFSPDDTINEYNRPATVVENGNSRMVESLSEEEMISFQGLGELERFLTDGLGTLPQTVKAREMHEYTLRYPGHAALMKSLRALGFFREDQITLNGSPVTPRKVLLELFKPWMMRGNERDLLVFRVEVTGRNSRVSMRYDMLDYYDPRRHVSAMARTTAYPCTAVALLVAKGLIDREGIVAPEEIAREDSRHFGFIRKYLAERGVRLRVRSQGL